MNAVAAVLELLLPTTCAGCDRRDGAETRTRGLCPDCVATLRRATPLEWSLRSTHLRGEVGVLRAFASGAYDGVLRAALLGYKEQGRLCLRRELGGCLAVSVLAAARVSADPDLCSCRFRRPSRHSAPAAMIGSVAWHASLFSRCILSVC